ncbi:hypothetical protein M409DRAFT_60381 [Zasmidium cellare ATCC 36951]|uniref:Short-chain dehydrogenase/reductase family protein n=1 Tax=Zasmidium cellare ATCC 36951 TaxID=1080233 RepID=A0A6A6C139_ZASCE|nr:uncharacterized protein M409DRAFT_60381 [Zasmidium cellare ATCC 36951]KAF2159978.1 hypothetical protein M409DRAFT_60381 [Zasmidium cellare ATCC 36951]
MAAMIRDRISPPTDVKPSFKGRNVLVTGSNVGMGFEAAVKFAALGAERLILGVRSLKKGEDAKAEIERRTGKKGVVEVWRLDMGDYESIKAFAKRVDSELEHLDVACLNAGVAHFEYETSQYGWDATLQINTISTALLSTLLLPKLKASKTGGSVPLLQLVSSNAHVYVASVKDGARKADSPLQFYSDRENFNGFPQYAISKLFLQFVQAGLIKSLGPVEKAGVEVVTICPGATKSTLSRDDFSIAVRLLLKLFQAILRKPTEQGARVYMVSADMAGKGHGGFYSYGKIQEPAATLVGVENEKLQEKVWEDVLKALRKDEPQVDTFLAHI